MCRLSRNLGASTSWNPKGLSRPVTGFLLYCKVLIGLNWLEIRPNGKRLYSHRRNINLQKNNFLRQLSNYQRFIADPVSCSQLGLLLPNVRPQLTQYLPPVYTTANSVSNNHGEGLLQPRYLTRRTTRRHKQQRRPTICHALCATVWTPGNGAATWTRAAPALSASATTTKGLAW
jgi:hypothetical protein